jgi:hypothetical protein
MHRTARVALSTQELAGFCTLHSKIYSTKEYLTWWLGWPGPLERARLTRGESARMLCL